jgi:hypothetical protein
MALQTINLGTYANDGTGDDLRTAFTKVNASLTELYGALYGANVGSVPPTSGVEQGELWWSTVEGRLYVYYSGAWIDASPSSAVEPSVSYTLSAESVVDGANLRLTGSDSTIDNVKIASSTNITVTRTDANTITLSSTSYTGNVTGSLTGNVTGTVSDISNHDLADLGNVSANSPTNGQALVYSNGSWIASTVATNENNTFEFGGFIKTFTNPVNYLLDAVGVDFGTFTVPSSYTIDLGTF